MFRNDREASHEQETSELRDKLQLEKERAEKLRKEVEALRAKPPTVIQKPLEPYSMRDADWPKKRNWNIFGRLIEFFTSHSGFKFIIVSFVIAMLAFAIYHEWYDIRDGYVTSMDYTPEHWSTITNSNGSTSSTYHPPEWSVEIGFEGNHASWSVTEEEFMLIHYGDWWCARDLLHEAPCVQNHPADF